MDKHGETERVGEESIRRGEEKIHRVRRGGGMKDKEKGVCLRRGGTEVLSHD